MPKTNPLPHKVWELASPESKACFDFLCGNHTRNLPIDRFNKLYYKWLAQDLGQAMRDAKSGSAVRLECNGIQFLRTVCRLTHKGPMQYTKYLGAILYDFETRASWKLYRVSAIQFIRSYSSLRASCWEATCEPVYRNAENGQFLVPAEEHVPDSKVIKATALQGYALAEYREGVDKDATYLPWVEQYVSMYCKQLTLTLNLITQDRPSSHETSDEVPPNRCRKRPAQSYPRNS